MYSSNPNNFEDLMSIAKQNADEAKRKADRLLLPDLNRPKRADPKQVKLKAGVQAFLAKKEEEERRRMQEEKVKKEKLLQLRNQDRKATNRVRKMLSMTKSANKSCVDDAKDCLNESIAAQGEIQPDEDDYGYTSNFADQMHKKMMEKYKAIPVKPAFPQERVPVPKPQSLSKNGTGWRNSNNNSYADSSPEQEYEEPVSTKKPMKPSRVPNKPPLPDYEQLLQLAQQKQHEPVLPVKPIVSKGEGDDFEFGRPMTKKEKAAFLAEKELKERVARRMMQRGADSNNNSSLGKEKPTTSFKIPKARPREEDVAPPKKAKIAEPEQSKPTKDILRSKLSEPSSNASVSKPNHMSSKYCFKQAASTSSNSMSSKYVEKPVKHNLPPPPSQPSKQVFREREIPKQLPKERETPKHITREREIPKHLPRETPKQSSYPKQDHRQQVNHNIEREKPRQRPVSLERDREQMRRPAPPNVQNPKPGSSREIPTKVKERVPEARENQRNGMSSKIKPTVQREREAERNPMRREREVPPQGPRYLPPTKRDMQIRDSRDSNRMSRGREEAPRMKPKPMKGRAIIDSDEEYDSEMDDFIDDSEVDLGNISAEISRIFNYDRRKYNYNEESDDECMESSVAQQMREEQRSLRLGIQEDLEDIRREEEEKRMKMLKMKKRR